MVNFGDAYEKRLSVRLTEKQSEKLQKLAFLFGCSESAYIRILLDSINLFEDNENENKKTF